MIYALTVIGAMIYLVGFLASACWIDCELARAGQRSTRIALLLAAIWPFALALYLGFCLSAALRRAA